MTAPTFDAHGWCHDMDAAPKDSGNVLVWAQPDGWGCPTVLIGGFYHGRWFTEECHSDRAPTRVTAWRPLPPPPTSET
jgi:hypothetical protein